MIFVGSYTYYCATVTEPVPTVDYYQDLTVACPEEYLVVYAGMADVIYFDDSSEPLWTLATLSGEEGVRPGYITVWEDNDYG